MGQTTSKKKCDGHTPVLVLNWGKGVYAGSKWESKGQLMKFDSILNCSGTAFVSVNHKIPFEWGKPFEKPAMNEMLLDWFNNQAVCIHPDFWLELKKFIIDKNQRILVCCEGGHGRTGTAIVALMLTTGQYKTWDAINELRKIYCDEAVETQVQADYLKGLEAYFKGEK